ncbi:MAG: YggS family pyridoxal phosphate-dependent enzyme [Vagococcus sp.]|uniref:YggS family pyridoxal phosphate-dependent enzyme n=1 Tax=Vagococcus sp. TaxID=1933889 RepID=UPI002FC927BE
MLLEQTLKKNIQKIDENIQTACELSNRDVESVQLICVSKSVDNDSTKQVVDQGITHLAENRMEKLLEKKEFFKDNPTITWHFIGNLQRRKVKLIINEIDYFHALDNVKLASEIDKRAEKKIKCFIQVNVSGEESKQGVTPDALEEFIDSLSVFENIVIVGLMTMAPYDANSEELHHIFSELNRLKKVSEDKNLAYAPCHELSMGMSRDYCVAISEGATFVRVGSSFFDEEEKEVGNS